MYKAGSQPSIFCTAIRYSTEYTVQAGLLCTPLAKFQILPSQLRLTADRAAGLCIKSLGAKQYSSSEAVVVVALVEKNTTKTQLRTN